MEQEALSFAVCGLDCTECAVYQAPHNPRIAGELAEHFRAHGHPDATPEWFHCDGCRGERSRCWSDTCWIWQCCVGEHGLESCAQCVGFPCARLEEWGAKSGRYTAALDRLRSMASQE